MAAITKAKCEESFNLWSFNLDRVDAFLQQKDFPSILRDRVSFFTQFCRIYGSCAPPCLDPDGKPFPSPTYEIRVEENRVVVRGSEGMTARTERIVNIFREMAIQAIKKNKKHVLVEICGYSHVRKNASHEIDVSGWPNDTLVKRFCFVSSIAQENVFPYLKQLFASVGLQYSTWDEERVCKFSSSEPLQRQQVTVVQISQLLNTSSKK